MLQNMFLYKKKKNTFTLDVTAYMKSFYNNSTNICNSKQNLCR